MVAREKPSSHASSINAELGNPRSQNKSHVTVSVSHCDAAVWICRHAIHKIRSKLLRFGKNPAHGREKQTDICFPAGHPWCDRRYFYRSDCCPCSGGIQASAY